MKCPECVKDNLKSRINIGASTSTLLSWQPYYDEDGVLHDDDPNTTITSYKCTNGHKWTVRKRAGKILEDDQRSIDETNEIND